MCVLSIKAYNNNNNNNTEGKNNNNRYAPPATENSTRWPLCSRDPLPSSLYVYVCRQSLNYLRHIPQTVSSCKIDHCFELEK